MSARRYNTGAAISTAGLRTAATAILSTHVLPDRSLDRGMGKPERLNGFTGKDGNAHV